MTTTDDVVLVRAQSREGKKQENVEDGLAILESCLRRKGSPAIAPRQKKQLSVKRDRCAGHVKAGKFRALGALAFWGASKTKPKSLLPRLKSDRGIPSTFESLAEYARPIWEIRSRRFPPIKGQQFKALHYFPDNRKSGLPIPLPVDRSRACPTLV